MKSLLNKLLRKYKQALMEQRQLYNEKLTKELSKAQVKITESRVQGDFQSEAINDSAEEDQQKQIQQIKNSSETWKINVNSPQSQQKKQKKQPEGVEENLIDQIIQKQNFNFENDQSNSNRYQEEFNHFIKNNQRTPKNINQSKIEISIPTNQKIIEYQNKKKSIRKNTQLLKTEESEIITLKKDKKYFSKDNEKHHDNFKLPKLQRKQLLAIQMEKKKKLKDLYDKKLNLHNKLKSLNSELIHIKEKLHLQNYSKRNSSDQELKSSSTRIGVKYILNKKYSQFQQNPEKRIQYQNKTSLTKKIQYEGRKEFKSKTASTSKNQLHPKVIYYLDGVQTLENVEQNSNELQKSNKAILFLKKIHEGSKHRKMNKMVRIHEDIQCKLAHVCVECTRSRCKLDAMESVMKNSRVG